jgi:hypothetical protein
VGIGTGDLGVGRHPVVRVGGALLGREQREERRQRVEREGLAGGEAQVLARELEPVADLVVADHRAIGGDDLHPQVEQRKAVIDRGSARWAGTG